MFWLRLLTAPACLIKKGGAVVEYKRLFPKIFFCRVYFFGTVCRTVFNCTVCCSCGCMGCDSKQIKNILVYSLCSGFSVSVVLGGCSGVVEGETTIHLSGVVY